MFMSAMAQIFSWGERGNVPFNEAKPNVTVNNFCTLADPNRVQ